VTAVLAEAFAVIRAEKVGSTLIVFLVAAMCAGVVLTAGRSVGSQREVLATIDQVGTRSIVVRAEPVAQVNSSVVGRLGRVEGIEWAGAFGPASDSRNAGFAGGQAVATRAFYSRDPQVLGIPESVALPGVSALATARALDVMGLPDTVGGLDNTAGAQLAVVGRFDLPDFLRFMEPVVLVPAVADPDTPGPVAIVVVITESPELVAVVSETVRQVLAATDLSEVSITTSEQYANLRAVIEGQLGTFSRSLIAAICGGLAVVITAFMYGLVMLRRKDYGRRRALGATRGLVVALVLLRAAVAALLGVFLGSLAALMSLMATGDPLPDASFIAAVAMLALASTTIGALLPAVAASRRDPLTELRVP
jgi:putative ABC transport system permease protein